jgi:hypothetical protein
MSRRTPHPCLNGWGTPKFPYGSEADAKAEVERIAVPGVRVYRCPFCRAYHIGHSRSAEGAESR